VKEIYFKIQIFDSDRGIINNFYILFEDSNLITNQTQLQHNRN